MKPTALFSANNLNKSYRHPHLLHLLKNISLTVQEGESVAICGRSGEGKTTLLHLFGTLEKPDTGELFIRGNLITAQNELLIRRMEIGFIFQSFNLLEDFSALDNVLLPAQIARFYGQSPKEAHLRAEQLLDAVGLSNRAHLFAKHLSGGERQRVAIARALCNRPSLILADEPSGNLDRANAERIGKLLLECVRQENKSLILVTHDLELAKLCDRRYFLTDGSLQEDT